MTPPIDRHSQPDSDEPPCMPCAQADRIESLESGMLEVVKILGNPPNDATGAVGTGMVGTLSKIAIDVSALKSRSSWPTAALRIAAMVLAVAVPGALAVNWLFTHMRFSP
jgi:hypothetical protein